MSSTLWRANFLHVEFASGWILLLLMMMCSSIQGWRKLIFYLEGGLEKIVKKGIFRKKERNIHTYSKNPTKNRFMLVLPPFIQPSTPIFFVPIISLVKVQTGDCKIAARSGRLGCRLKPPLFCVKKIIFDDTIFLP